MINKTDDGVVKEITELEIKVYEMMKKRNNKSNIDKKKRAS